MAQPADRKNHIIGRKDIAQFNQALGALNTFLVTKVINATDPDKVQAVTDSIVTFLNSEGQCDPGYIWDETQRACVRQSELPQQ